MKREDISGQHIFSANIWSKMLSNGKKLVENGYSESANKPNLFYSKKDYGIFFADMRGTKLAPIWNDPRPLFYWIFDNDQPLWKHRRQIKEELLNLEKNNVEYSLCLVVENLLFEQSNVIGDEVNLIFPWFDGFCEFCGKDFQNDGRFCSIECEKKCIEKIENEQEEQRLCLIKEGPLIECCVCKKNTQENPETVYHKHHVSYFPEEIVITCLSCHQAIHNTEEYPHLKPKNIRLLAKEIRKLERIAKIELTKKNGTFSKNYCSLCEREIKINQSYSFYCGKKIHTKCFDNKTDL